MNIRQIRQLAEIMAEYGLTQLELQDNEQTISLARGGQPAAACQPVPAAVPAPVAVPEPAAEAVPDDHAICAPMPGIFYAAPSPDAEPFVTVGSHVQKGDTVCIVEAMKLMNEITADCSGEIVEVCLQNGELVEYGQPLFKVR